MKHRGLVADFDVRSRVFTGNHGSFYNLREGDNDLKGGLIQRYLDSIDNDAGAFSGFSKLKPERFRGVNSSPDVTYPGEGVEILPEDVLMQAGGLSMHVRVASNNVLRAQYTHEPFGFMCVAPGVVSYPNGIADRILSYRGGQCVAAGAPWPFPLGLQLPEKLGDPALISSNLHWLAPPNAQNASLLRYPFVDESQNERFHLHNFNPQESANSAYGQGNVVGKFYSFNPGAFDEGFSRFPEMRYELLEQFPGIVDSFLQYAVKKPRVVSAFY